MPTRRGRRSLIPTFLVGCALVLFTAFVMIAYRRHPIGASGQLPVIAAEPGPVKVKPDNPGGTEIPFQDTTVYDELTQHKGRRASSEVEHLLQPPEQPLPKPQPPAAEAARSTFDADAPAARVPGTSSDADSPPGDVETSTSDNPSALAPVTAHNPSAIPANKLPLPPAPESQAANGQDRDGSNPEAAIAPSPSKQASKAIPQKAKPVNTGAGGGMIQLGAFRDEASANGEWKRLQARHADQLSPLSPSIQRVDLGDKGIWFRLKAGPLGPDIAKQTCATLKAANVSCIAVSR